MLKWLLKDEIEELRVKNLKITGKTTVYTDVINEFTTDSGVTVDGCLIKDGKASEADKLDGKHGSEFVLKSGDTMSGTLNMNVGSPGSLRQYILLKDSDGTQRFGLSVAADDTPLIDIKQSGKSLRVYNRADNTDALVHCGGIAIGSYKLNSLVADNKVPNATNADVSLKVKSYEKTGGGKTLYTSDNSSKTCDSDCLAKELSVPSDRIIYVKWDGAGDGTSALKYYDGSNEYTVAQSSSYTGSAYLQTGTTSTRKVRLYLYPDPGYDMKNDLFEVYTYNEYTPNTVVLISPKEGNVRFTRTDGYTNSVSSSSGAYFGYIYKYINPDGNIYEMDTD